MKTELKNSTIRFQAQVLESGKVAIPASAGDRLPPGRLMAEGLLQHFPFRAPVESRTLLLSPVHLVAARVLDGDIVAIEITRVNEEPEVRVPAELAAALEDHPAALDQWNATTTKARRDWVLWFLTAKQEKTRKSRIVRACDMLSKGKGRACCFGGLNWINKDHEIAADETWSL